MVFLQSWRATIIPLVAIPVSLIGTFAVMAALGFSLNNLSLFGLVLAIGIVVDDAIVVVENIERNIADGLSPRDAARKRWTKSADRSFRSRSCSGGLRADRVPRRHLRPILPAVRAHDRGLHAHLGVRFAHAQPGAGRAAPAAARREERIGSRDFGTSPLAGSFAASIAPSTEPSTSTPTRRSHHPHEPHRALRLCDCWRSRGSVSARCRSDSFRRTTRAIPSSRFSCPTARRSNAPTPSIQTGDRHRDENARVPIAVGFAGFSGATRANASNAARFFTPSSPSTSAEKRDGPTIMADLRKAFAQFTTRHRRHSAAAGARTRHGRRIQDGGAGSLRRRSPGAAKSHRKARRRRAAIAGLVQVFSPFRASTPQLFARDRPHESQDARRAAGNVFDTLQIFLGSSFVNEFNLFGRTYRVTAQAEPQFRDDVSDIAQLKTRNRAGRMVPLGSLVNLQQRPAPTASFATTFTRPPTSTATRARLQLRPIHRHDGGARPQNPAAGLQLRVDRHRLSAKAAGNAALYIFPLCVLFVFLTLAAQYESWSLPLAVILIVPMWLLARSRRVVPRDGQQHSHADRLRRARRSRLQKRDPHRRVREQTGARRARTASPPRSRPAACACGRF